VSGATYAWTGPNGFTSALQNPTHASATTADAGTYSVTITVNGCTSAAGTTNVVVNPTPATPTATNGGPYCNGSTVQLNTPAVAGATYSWTGPNGFTSSQQNPTIASATSVNSGTYSVTITVSGCSSAAGTTNVSVSATLPAPTATNGGAYCTGSTIQLNTPTVSGATYSWSGPNGFTSALQNPTRSSATTADAGTYSVTITVNGCTSAAGTTNVVVNAIPATPTISAGGATTFCAGGSVTLTSNSASGNQWLLNGSPIGGATGNTYNATASGNYTVVVTASGCSSASSAATAVTVNPIPATPTISAGSATTFCAGGSVTLTSSASNGNQWSVNGAPISGATGTTYVASTAGDYTVKTTANGCPSAASLTTTVTVNAIPSATITVASTMTSGASATASVAGAGSGATYLWSITGGTINSGAGTPSINFTAGAVGTLTLNATVTRSGCSDAKSANVTVTATPPSQKFDPNGDNTIDPADIFYLVNYLFTGGPAPAGTAGMLSGDANGDGVVDPADIFYVVNYLFTGGPHPMSTQPPRATITSTITTSAISGSIMLGTPHFRGRKAFVPVIVSSGGGITPGAISLRLRIEGTAADPAIHRVVAGTPSFEITRASAHELSYLLSFDGNGLLQPGQPATIAEIELTVEESAGLSLDPALTMLTDGGGRYKATVAAGTLHLGEIRVEPRAPRPETPRPDAQ
jgi:hypothetical protein